MDKRALKLALARNVWVVLAYVPFAVALAFRADDPDWLLASRSLVALVSLSLAIYIWLDYREEVAKRSGEQEGRSSMWWRDRLVATTLLIVAGAIALWFLSSAESDSSRNAKSSAYDVSLFKKEERTPRYGGPNGGHANTLAEIVRLGTDFQRVSALHTLVGMMGRDDLDNLLDEADSLPTAQEANAIKRVIYSRYVELDPTAAVGEV